MISVSILNKLILPEISITMLIGLMLLMEIVIPKKFKISIYLTSQAGLLITIFFIWKNFNIDQQQLENLNNNFLDKYGFVFKPEVNCLKLMIVSFAFLNFVYIKDCLNQVISNIYTEYFLLNLFCVLGVMLLISSNNFFNLYFGIEMTFLPIYILIGINQNHLNLEIVIKYIILSAIFSGLFLYGMSLVYGAGGGLTFKSIMEFVETQHISGIFNIGVTLVLIGILFKLYVFPFQLWVSDVYSITSNQVIILISSLPKVALISTLGYLFKDILYIYINSYWKNILLIIALSSMFIGNFGAIIQNNFKRMLAYSAIANSGFILLGLINNTTEGALAANFYVLSYAFSIINIFGCLIILNNRHCQIETIEDFIGLSRKHPWISAMLLILLLSILGIPPTIGFYAKFLIIKSLIKINLNTIAVLAVLLSSVNLIYYLKIIKNIYFLDKDNQDIISNNQNFYCQSEAAINNHNNLASVAVLSINSLLILLLGFFRLFTI